MVFSLAEAASFSSACMQVNLNVSAACESELLSSRVAVERYQPSTVDWKQHHDRIRLHGRVVLLSTPPPIC